MTWLAGIYQAIKIGWGALTAKTKSTLSLFAALFVGSKLKELRQRRKEVERVKDASETRSKVRSMSTSDIVDRLRKWSRK